MEQAFQIIGILNVTPDSYYDGGKYDQVERAVRRAGEMLGAGADIIEIGGESTGPGSRDVPADGEAGRVMPVIAAIRRAYPDARLSVDTYKSAVAKEALSLGVSMVNDVTAGRGDAALFSVVAPSDAQIVLLYAKDPTARTTVGNRRYGDVVAEVSAFLAERCDAAVAAGIPAHGRIILDPGLGHFVSVDPRYSFEIIARLSAFRALGCPLLLSPSRKSFLAGGEKLPPGGRLPGTVAASAIAGLFGAFYIRTHDVAEVRRGCEIAAEIAAAIERGSD